MKKNHSKFQIILFLYNITIICLRVKKQMHLLYWLRRSSNFYMEWKEKDSTKKAKLHCLSWPDTVPPLCIPFFVI